MLRFLIVAHAPLASALRAVAAHIDADAVADIGVFDVRPEHSAEDIAAGCAPWLERCAGCELLVLTDVFGATPCNGARRIGERPGTRVVAGVNVPALWRALGYRHEPLDKVADLAVAGGQQGLMHVSVSRPQHQAAKQTPHDSKHDHHQQ